MRWFWVSSPRMTCGVALDENDIIVDAAPILRRFIGQPAKNLGRWMRGHGEFWCARLP